MQTADKKDEFVSQLHEWIDDSSRKIDELRVQANLAKAETKEEIDKRIHQLETKRQDVKKELEHLGQTSSDAYDTLKKGCERSWNEFRASLDDALAKFRS